MDVVDLSRQDIAHQLLKIKQRQTPTPGKRQEDFNSVELLMCYGLFYILDPHRFGGRNIHLVPDELNVLARFFKRSVSSITSKMLNMDGSRAHGGKDEVRIFACLSASPDDYIALYKDVIRVARELLIGEDLLPDFLDLFHEKVSDDTLLLGQDELPVSNAYLLKTEEHRIKEVATAYELSNALTEKMFERKVRMAQHRFASTVLGNCKGTCVFCGFQPRMLGKNSGLLRASHIKPWAKSNDVERTDVRNGLTACVIHDAGFDQGYLTIEDTYVIRRAATLQQSIISDQVTEHYFGSIMYSTLLLPALAKKPALHYLHYHRENIFRG
ncbi:HNH endonuclease [Dictyobacter aurantiacus]|uniref:Restriction endonuclease n=1 Tax=Dictyobacter aurantiacus TaxID=1936993 RepID=A0A401ZAK6_9CHLR|nr:HNH endonuclease [Dictyobacter aurantiacus]GCE03836.1 restriction endonuclease [Dictyobacter aurantiacus]